MSIKIDYNKCCWKDGACSSSGCGCSCGKACIGCVEACPVSALKREKKLILDKEKCIECGACVASCKHQAIKLE